jgi:hypothetical protein
VCFIACLLFAVKRTITVRFVGEEGTMTRVSVSLCAVLVTVVAPGVPAGAAATAPVPPQDFVVGGGEVGIFHEISINARSDPMGGDPSGAVSFVVEVSLGGPVVRLRFEGLVMCLAVEGNRAVIRFLSFLGPIKVVVVDNGSTGSPADDFGAIPFAATDCSDDTGVGLSPLSLRDIVVRDAPTNAQCKDGGWRNYTDTTGQPFRNQGDCIAFALGAA